jgi:transposase InsO family protein
MGGRYRRGLALHRPLKTAAERADRKLQRQPARRRLNEEIFDSVPDARQKLALWRYDYNNVRPHSSLGNKTSVEARRALEQSDGTAPAALAQPETDDYQQTRLSS